MEVAEADPKDLAESDRPRPVKTVIGLSDHLFRGLSRTAGLIVLAIMSLVGLFLLYRGWQALSKAGAVAFITTERWEPDSNNFGIAAVLTGTVLIALVAVVLAVPLATGTALYIAEYAPLRIKSTLISLVDLMAAVPSI